MAALRRSESSAPRRREKDGASTKVEPYAPSAQSEGLFCRCFAVVFLAVVSSSLSLPRFVCNFSCAADRAVALPTAIACAYSPIIAHSLDPQSSHTTRLLTAASCARFGEATDTAGGGKTRTRRCLST